MTAVFALKKALRQRILTKCITLLTINPAPFGAGFDLLVD